MKFVVSKEKGVLPIKEAHRFQSMVSIKLFTLHTVTVKGIKDKKTKDAIKSKN